MSAVKDYYPFPRRITILSCHAILSLRTKGLIPTSIGSCSSSPRKASKWCQLTIIQTKRTPVRCPLLSTFCLRRDWDSNPGYSRPYAAFRVRSIRPLWHLSCSGYRPQANAQSLSPITFLARTSYASVTLRLGRPITSSSFTFMSSMSISGAKVQQ